MVWHPPDKPLLPGLWYTLKLHTGIGVRPLAKDEQPEVSIDSTEGMRAMSQKLRAAFVPALVVLTFVAIPTASASAQPEYKRCVKAEKVGKTYPSGEYSNRTCTAPEKEGPYKLEAAAPGTKLLGASAKSTITIKNSFGEVVQTIVCKADTSKGETTSAQYANVAVIFYGCTNSSGEACGNIAKETIETAAETYSELLWLPGKVTGERLAHFAGPIATFTCGTETIALEGSVLGRIENTSFGTKITFAVVAAMQEYLADEEGTPYHLYTEGEESREATLQTTEAQLGPGVYQ
jgi:hypothetical protein